MAPPPTSQEFALPPAARSGLVPPMVVWMLVQLVVLAMSAAEVRLWARFNDASQRIALDAMLVVQITASAMLFPYLLRDWRLTGMIIAFGWVFVITAAILADVSWDRALEPAVYLALWILALALIGRALKTRRMRFAGVAIAGAGVLGGPMLWYLAAEFVQGEPVVTWASHGLLGPVMGVLAVRHAPDVALPAWLLGLCLLLAGFLTARRGAGGSTKPPIDNLST